jgi:2-dehydropantoate 2-reductase
LRYLIFGSGAVGSYLGVRLALSGRSVSFLTRDRYVHDLRSQGFTLDGDGASRHLPQPSVYADPTQAIHQEKPDFILLTVKAYDVAEAARTLAPLLTDSQTVVSFLNGINNEATLAENLGEAMILPATLTTAVRSPKPGSICVERVRGIGLAGDHPRLGTLYTELKAAGFMLRLYPDPDRMKWSKLLTNIVSNASSAILGWTPEQVYAHPGIARLEIESIREAVRVLRRLSLKPQNLPDVQVGLLGKAIFLPSPLIRRLLGQIVSKGRGDKKPSFHYDIGRGHSEVEWLNGAVVKHGGTLGVPTPVNQVLTRTLLELVHHQHSHQDFLDQPQKLLQQLAP